MSRYTDTPIFFDQRGRRWKFVKAIGLGVAAVVTFFGMYSIPKVLQPAAVTAYSQQGASLVQAKALRAPPPAQLTDVISRSNAPVIGDGPLVRVVRIVRTAHGAEAVPVYGQYQGEQLSPDQVIAIDNHPYAIERYGQTNGKRIALTFDDGPDPTWTPKVLDILSAYHVRATFFTIGNDVVKYPAIAKREVREGHIIGNHTFDHVNFHMVGNVRAEQELNQAQRILRATTGYSTSFARLPYGGNNSQSLRDFVRGILEAQRQGYVVTYYGFDSNDWGIASGDIPSLPQFDGRDIVVLLHDGGGNRSSTIAYVTTLVQAARTHGYSFVTLNNLYPQKPMLFVHHAPSFADKLALYMASAYLVWPHQLLHQLFFITVFSVAISMVVSVILAAINIRRTKYRRRKNHYEPLVSVIVPAFNEEAVLAKTVSSLLHSYYRWIEVVIVDDGSKDATWTIAQTIARKHPRVRAYHKRNGGKARALNYGIRQARGEIIVSIDADTVFLPTTIGKLVRHFADESVGAVAGAVKIGNVRGLLTRWQALDYTIGIYIERNAQALLGSVMIVPGACGAWRKTALEAVHGYSSSTLAEDFDLTLALHQMGYRVLQDNEALSYTEAPLDIASLFKQRFRWIFGDIQTFWKYRQLLFRRRYHWVGSYSLPLAIYSIVVPLLFGPLLLTIEIENLLSGNYAIVLLFLTVTIALQFLLAAIGLVLAREKLRYLVAVPLTRILYSPLRSFIVYRSLLHALKGAHEGWHKLQRTGTVRYASSPQLETVRIVK